MNKGNGNGGNGSGRARVKFTHPRDDRTFEADISPEVTGEVAIKGLVANRFIDAPGGSRAYVLQHTRSGQTIPPSQKFGSAGVTDGDTIAIVESEPGASRLSPSELRDRLAFDFETTMALSSPALGGIQAFASNDDLRRSRPATDGRRAALYLVPFRFRMLLSAGQWFDEGATTRFDLLAGGNYPFTPPSVSVISRPLPFCARVSPGSGAVCIARTWGEKRGQVLMAELIVHVMRLLNHDEPEGGDRGMNPAAREYDIGVLRGLPLHTGLAYPAVPVALTHGADAPAIAVGDEPFLPVERAAQGLTFAPVSPRVGTDLFLPVA